MSSGRNPLCEFTPNSQGTIAKLVVREQLIGPNGQPINGGGGGTVSVNYPLSGDGSPGNPLSIFPYPPPVSITTDASLIGDGQSSALGCAVAGLGGYPTTNLRGMGTFEPSLWYLDYADFRGLQDYINLPSWSNGAAVNVGGWGTNDTVPDAIGLLQLYITPALSGSGQGYVYSRNSEDMFKPSVLTDLWFQCYATVTNNGATGFHPVIGFADVLDWTGGVFVGTDYAYFSVDNISANWQFVYSLTVGGVPVSDVVDTGVAFDTNLPHRFHVRMALVAGSHNLQWAIDGGAGGAAGTIALGGALDDTVRLQDAWGFFTQGEVSMPGGDSSVWVDWTHIAAKRLTAVP